MVCSAAPACVPLHHLPPLILCSPHCITTTTECVSSANWRPLDNTNTVQIGSCPPQAWTLPLLLKRPLLFCFPLFFFHFCPLLLHRPVKNKTLFFGLLIPHCYIMSPMDSRKLPSMPRETLYNGLVACLLSLSIGYVIGSPNIPEASIRGSPGGGCGPVQYTIQGGFPNCLEFSDLLWVSPAFRFLSQQN